MVFQNKKSNIEQGDCVTTKQLRLYYVGCGSQNVKMDNCKVVFIYQDIRRIRVERKLSEGAISVICIYLNPTILVCY